MKPYYFQESKNFGDILNLWLWPQLLPSIFDEDAGIIFVGIGTLLNNFIPKEPFKVVFGAGVGYGNGIPIIDKSWKIYCVRGPLSAQALALPPKLAITDPAVLFRKVNLPQEHKLYPISFMPHWVSTRYLNWDLICRNIDLHFIDPQAEVEQVLHDIQCSELVITEAMHGAIVADALRVPWIPIKIFKGILEFKWHDWCQSLGLDYKPVRLPRFYSEERILARFRNLLQSSGFYNNSASKLLARAAEFGAHYMLRRVNITLSNRISRSLKKVVKTAAPTLSSDQIISSVTLRLEEKLEQFRTDYTSGCFIRANPEL